jgi:multisubunit Na+/H+ antiporter MnhF subunit
MNLWLIAAAGLMLGFVPCAVVLVRARTMERLVAVQSAGTLTTVILLLLSAGFRQPSFSDLALTSALLSYPASLLFAKFFERWL